MQGGGDSLPSWVWGKDQASPFPPAGDPNRENKAQGSHRPAGGGRLPQPQLLLPPAHWGEAALGVPCSPHFPPSAMNFSHLGHGGLCVACGGGPARSRDHGELHGGGLYQDDNPRVLPWAGGPREPSLLLSTFPGCGRWIWGSAQQQQEGHQETPQTDLRRHPCALAKHKQRRKIAGLSDTQAASKQGMCLWQGKGNQGKKRMTLSKENLVF